MTERPRRITILGHTAELGGAELSLVRLCSALVDYDVAIHVILFADGPLVGRLRDLDIPVEVVHLATEIATASRASAKRFSLWNFRTAVRVLPFLARLTRAMAQTRPDLVHSTTLKSNLLSAPSAKLLRKPLVWQFHDRISGDYMPAALARVLRVAARVVPDAVVTNSVATAATLGSAAARSIVVYPGFSADQAVDWEDVRLASEVPVVGLIGRISPTKGQLELVRAAEQVLAEFPEARFRVIGSPMFGAEEYERRVKQEAAQLRVDGAFSWLGFVGNVADEVDRLSVLVHASPTPEPFGQVIVEAMVRGVPVIATRGGGVVEILEPPEQTAFNSLGHLVNPGSVDELSAAILRVLREPTQAQDQARRAHASASARFAIRESAQGMVRVWCDTGPRRGRHGDAQSLTAR